VDHLTVQLQIGGVWTSYPCLVEDAVTVKGGLAKDAGIADPMVGTAMLRDDLGELVARNPRSPLFGLVGRGVPARILVPDRRHLWVPTNLPADAATTPDTAALDIVGDLDIRVDFAPIRWQFETATSIGGKYSTAGNQRSWSWWVDDLKQLVLRWSPNGTSITTVRSTMPVVHGHGGRVSLRATLDVDNGAGGWTVTFYTSTTPGVAGPWTQLGDPVSSTGVTSIFASTAELSMGYAGVAMDATRNRYFHQQVRAGIGGTVVADTDFTAPAAGVSSFVDATGLTWTVPAGSELRDYDIRQSGRVANWPTKWTTSGRKIWAPIQIGGPLRDMQRVKTPLRSPLFREATKTANLSVMPAYWPGEDLSESTQVASGLSTGAPMTSTGATAPTYADNARFPGSDPLITLANGVRLQGVVPSYAATGVLAFRMLADVPLLGWPADATIAQVTTLNGAVRTWLLEVSNLGSLRLRGLNSSGTEISNTGYIAFDVFQRRQMIGWQLTQVGADAYWQIFTRRIADDLTVSEVGLDGTFTNRVVGRAGTVVVAPGQNLDGGGIGHFMVGSAVSLASGIDQAIVGWNSERTGRRLLRVAAENGRTIRIVGHPDASAALGPQKSGTELEIYRRCAEADRGILGEARDEPILEYRTRNSMYSQPSVATLQYGQRGESPDLDPDEPIDDVVNDYTATREGGSSYRSVVETGRLSVQDWPDGVGRQDQAGTTNMQTDGQMFAVAGWETFLGTWDEQRHPKVRFNVTKLEDLGKNGLAEGLMSITTGDRYIIQGPGLPVHLPPTPIELIALGWQEEHRARRKFITFNNMHGRPWQVGIGAVTPADSDGTTLVGALTAVPPGTVEMVAVDVVGVPWSTASVFPLVMEIWRNGLAAERVSVSAISGTSSPQMFTMERGIDGVTVAHDAGAALWLYAPLRVAR
jgi:hypothetical protein